MNRRIYYLLPSVKKAHEVVDALLLKRISIKELHVMAKEGTNIGDLPEATVLETSDIRHALVFGLMAGAIVGVVAGVLFHYVMEYPLSGWMLLALLVGALFGGWAATMIGMSTDNPEIERFREPIAKGKILLMVDVPIGRLDEIETEIKEVSPKAKFEGLDPTYPSFP